MTSIFQQLDSLIKDPMPGWGDAEKTKRMAAMVLALQPDVSMEIGVYGGRTFLGLALAHKFIGRGMAVGIDPWSNEAAVEGYEGENRKFWENNPLDKIHDDFMALLDRLGLNNVTRIHRQRSDEVVPQVQIDLLHVDGQHSEQAVRDVNRFASLVRVGGLTIMDDIAWQNGVDAPVARAVIRLREMGFVQLYELGTGAVFTRIR